MWNLAMVWSRLLMLFIYVVWDHKVLKHSGRDFSTWFPKHLHRWVVFGHLQMLLEPLWNPCYHPLWLRRCLFIAHIVSVIWGHVESSNGLIQIADVVHCVIVFFSFFTDLCLKFFHFFSIVFRYLLCSIGPPFLALLFHLLSHPSEALKSSIQSSLATSLPFVLWSSLFTGCPQNLAHRSYGPKSQPPLHSCFAPLHCL